MGAVRIAPLTSGHADEVIRIYQLGIDGRLATFETEAPTWAEFDASRLPRHRFVALDDHGVVLGWVAVTPVSSRQAYAGVVEHSVYVDRRARGLGVGRALLERLVADAPRDGIWTIQTSIMAGNGASLALHESVGFRVVGRRERIAQRDGVWHDTVLLELRLP